MFGSKKTSATAGAKINGAIMTSSKLNSAKNN